MENTILINGLLLIELYPLLIYREWIWSSETFWAVK